jgi:Tim10/DDP family zinc finger
MLCVVVLRRILVEIASAGLSALNEGKGSQLLPRGTSTMQKIEEQPTLHNSRSTSRRVTFEIDHRHGPPYLSTIQVIQRTMDQINSLTPEQRQAVLMQAQQEANQRVMQDMVQRMVKTCFQKCAGTSVSSVFRLFFLGSSPPFFFRGFSFFLLLRKFERYDGTCLTEVAL